MQWTNARVTKGKTAETSIRLDKDANYIVYARITDAAGNISYLSSDGVIIDTTAPVIAGIADGGIYQSDMTFTVSDLYLKSVTINGTGVTLAESYALPAVAYGADGTYHIVEEDTVGNKTEYTVTVQKLSDLASKVSDENSDDDSDPGDNNEPDDKATIDATDTVDLGGSKITLEDLIDIAEKLDVKDGSLCEELGVTPSELVEMLFDEETATSIKQEIINRGLAFTTVESGDEAVLKGSFVDDNHVIATLLTAEDIVRLAAGDTLEIRLVIKPKNSPKNPEIFESQIEENMEVGTYMDIDLYKILGSNIENEDLWEHITEMEEPISFTVSIPETLRAKNREYLLIISHENEDGGVDYLRSEEMDEEGENIICNTDRLCEAVLLIQDAKASDEADAGNFVLFNLLAIIGILLMTLYNWKKKKEWRIAEIIYALAAIVAYIILFTSGQLVLFAGSSIVFAILLLFALVVTVCIIRSEKSQDDML